MMAIHLNPFRLFNSRICLNHGIIVEILRSSQVFWEAYKDLLEANFKRKSGIDDLNIVMKKMGLEPKEQKGTYEKDLKKLHSGIVESFDKALLDLDGMISNLNTIIRNDETLLFRAVEELRKIYLKFRFVQHIPHYMIAGIEQHIHSLLKHMAVKQKEAWVVSKAHSRGFTKLQDLTIVTSRGERRRIRQQTIELDHIRNRIEFLRDDVTNLSKVTEHEHVHRLHAEISELLKLYHDEITDLAEILHESDVLIRRTEQMFKEVSKEAEEIGFNDIKKKVDSYSHKFHKIMLAIETQARRESMDIDKIVAHLPSPRKVQHKSTEHISTAQN